MLIYSRSHGNVVNKVEVSKWSVNNPSMSTAGGLVK
jgi:hypothetical protein